MIKIEMLCAYYRGRTTFVELMNMPLSYINALYDIAHKRQQAEQEEKERKEAEGQEATLTPTEAMMLEDEMEAALG